MVRAGRVEVELVKDSVGVVSTVSDRLEERVMK